METSTISEERPRDAADKRCDDHDEADHEHHEDVPLEPPLLQGVHNQPMSSMSRELVRPHII